MSRANERFISVDVETSGPIPGEFSLLTIGACDVDQEDVTFSCALKPLNRNADPKALEVTGLSLDALEKDGLVPSDAMQAFRSWLDALSQDGETLVFVGFNAPFDWSFVNYYFHKFSDGNPFGFAALDIKAFYMGVAGCDWADTRSSKISEHLKPNRSGTHNALDDALYQAELFRRARDVRSAQS